MFFQITLGDVIGWIITIISVGIAVTIKIKVDTRHSDRSKKINQSRSYVKGDQIGIFGDTNDREN